MTSKRILMGVAIASLSLNLVMVSLAMSQPTQTVIGKDGRPKTIVANQEPPAELTPIDFAPYDNEAEQIGSRLVKLWDATTDDRSSVTIYSEPRSWTVVAPNGTRYMIQYGPTTDIVAGESVPAFHLTVAEVIE